MKNFEITSLADILKPENKSIKNYISRKVKDIVKNAGCVKNTSEDEFECLYKQIRLFIVEVIAHSYCHPKDEGDEKGDKPKYILDAMTESVRLLRNYRDNVPDNTVEAFFDHFIHRLKRLSDGLSTPMKYWVWRSDRDYAIHTERGYLNFDNSDILTIIEMINDRRGDPDKGFDELVVKIFEYGHRRPYYQIYSIKETNIKEFRMTISSKFFNTMVVKSKYSSTYWSSPIDTDELTVSIVKNGHRQYSVKIKINDKILMEI